jgi:DNA polymerase-3 subunit beta
LTGTDLDIEMRASVGAKVEGLDKGSAAITLHAATLYDIVRKLAKDAEIRLEWEGEAGQAVLRAGRSRFTLPSLSAADFSDITTGEMTHHFTLPAKTLAHMIEKTQFAISTEETRYYLNGIYIHAIEDRLTAVATDGHRLARSTLPLPEGAAGMPGIIVPRKTVAELLKLLKDAEEVSIALSTAKIIVEAGATRITSKLIDGSFPDYIRVIPAGNDRIAMIDRAELAAAADRVSTVSSERLRAVKLSLGDGSLMLATRSADACTGEEELSVEYAATPMEIGLNSRYLLDILGAIDGDTVCLAMADSGSPALFTTPTDENLTFVLMPMRV